MAQRIPRIELVIVALLPDSGPDRCETVPDGADPQDRVGAGYSAPRTVAHPIETGHVLGANRACVKITPVLHYVGPGVGEIWGFDTRDAPS